MTGSVSSIMPSSTYATVSTGGDSGLAGPTYDLVNGQANQVVVLNDRPLVRRVLEKQIQRVSKREQSVEEPRGVGQN